MSNIAIRTGAYRVQDLTIEQIFEELYRYSFPSVRASDVKGLWSANAEMRIKVQGAEFTVRSEYGHKSPKDALVQLLERVLSAVEQVGGKLNNNGETK